MVETKVEKVRVVEIEKERGKEVRKERAREKTKEEKTKKKKNNGSEEDSKRMGNLVLHRARSWNLWPSQ